jgi:hypothetical protein
MSLHFSNNSFLFYLFQVGVKAILKIYHSLPHGFLNMPSDFPEAPDAIRSAAGYIIRMAQEAEERQLKQQQQQQLL